MSLGFENPLSSVQFAEIVVYEAESREAVTQWVNLFDEAAETDEGAVLVSVSIQEIHDPATLCVVRRFQVVPLEQLGPNRAATVFLELLDQTPAPDDGLIGQTLVASP